MDKEHTWWSGFWKTKLFGRFTYTVPFVGLKTPAKIYIVLDIV